MRPLSPLPPPPDPSAAEPGPGPKPSLRKDRKGGSQMTFSRIQKMYRVQALRGVTEHKQILLYVPGWSGYGVWTEFRLWLPAPITRGKTWSNTWTLTLDNCSWVFPPDCSNTFLCDFLKGREEDRQVLCDKTQDAAWVENMKYERSMNSTFSFPDICSPVVKHQEGNDQNLEKVNRNQLSSDSWDLSGRKKML